MINTIFNVIPVTGYAEFNWAFTLVLSFFPVLLVIKMVIRVFSRS